MPELSSETVSRRRERRQEKERQGERGRREKEGGKTRRAIPHRRAETKNTLIRYERFPTCLTLGPYRYRSVTHGEPECTRARARTHCHGSIASGAAVIVIRYRRALSAKFEPGTEGEGGEVRGDRGAASTAGKLT